MNRLRRRQEPASVAGHPSDEEWQTGLPSSPGFYYVRDLLDESIGGDNRPVYVNPKHFVWGFWEQDDPEWIGLDSDITPENIQWKPVAPPLAPPAAVTVQPGDEELLLTYGLAKRDYNYEGPLDDWPKRAERAATVAGLRAVLALCGNPAQSAPPATPISDDANV